MLAYVLSVSLPMYNGGRSIYLSMLNLIYLFIYLFHCSASLVKSSKGKEYNHGISIVLVSIHLYLYSTILELVPCVNYTSTVPDFDTVMD